MNKQIILQTQAPTTSAAAYTATVTTTIDQAVVSNPTATDDTLSVWLVPDGGAAVDATNIYTDLPVVAGSSQVLGLLINHAVPQGASIHLLAGTSATALTVTVSGRKL